MGLLPVNVKWEVSIANTTFKKLVADILIFRRIEDEPDTIKVLRMVDNNGRWVVEEKKEDNFRDIKPTLQLPWECLDGLAKALHDLGFDGAGDSKLAGKCEAQEKHLQDLQQIVLAFISGGKSIDKLLAPLITVNEEGGVAKS